MSSSSVSSVATTYAPWRKGIAWWVVLIQGIILGGLGAWALLQAKVAILVILLGIGAYLIIMGIWLIVQAMRGHEAGFSIFGLLASGGGLTAGLALIIPLLLLPERDGVTLMVAFGVAMITVGLLALLGTILERRTGAFSWMSAVRSAAYILLGLVLITSVRLESTQVLVWVAWIAVVLGVLLILYSILLQRRQRGPAKAEDAS